LVEGSKVANPSKNPGLEFVVQVLCSR